MKTIGAVLVIVVGLLSSAVHAQTPIDVDKVQQAMFASLVLDDDLGRSRLGARAIRKFYPKNEALTDLIAECLMRETATTVQGRRLNTVAWYVIMLGETQNSRYRDILRQVQERTTIKKLLDDISDALKQMTDNAAIQYVPGSIDIAAKRTEAAKILADNRRSDRSRFGSITQGSTLVEILQALGAPDALTAWTVRTQKMEVHYFGAGLIVLSIDNVDQPRWVTYTAARELMPIQKMYTGENLAIAQNLGSLQNKLLVQFYKTSGRRIHNDLSAMELTVRRITEIPYPDDRDEEEAVLRILKRFALSPDPRAGAVVKSIADSSIKNDGTKFAKRMWQIREKRIAKGWLTESAANDPDLKEEADEDAEEDIKDK